MVVSVLLFGTVTAFEDDEMRDELSNDLEDIGLNVGVFPLDFGTHFWFGRRSRFL